MARIKNIDKLTLKDMMFNLEDYSGLSDGLVQLPIPEYIKIDGKYFFVPVDMDEFTEKLCYGQRLFIAQKEVNDFGVIIRIMDGYYYPQFTKRPWNADNALKFGSKILDCLTKDVFPIGQHMIKLIAEMAEQERKLIHRDPSKIELAAGIEKLNGFAEMTSLDFLRDTMKITIEQVLLTPYKECLVRFMIAKETEEYKERYLQLMQEINKSESKYQQK
jgi:hypothetical protein